MNDSNAYLLMEQQSRELRCGGLSGISTSSDQPSTWHSSTVNNSDGISTTDSALPASSPYQPQHHHQQQHYYQKPSPIVTSSTHSTSLSQRRYHFQSSPSSPSVNTMMMIDIPTPTANYSAAVAPLSATTSSSASTCSTPPATYWPSSSTPSTTQAFYQNQPSYHHQQQQHYDQQTSAATPVQYQQAPIMQSPIVSTTRSHSVKRNKLRQSSYSRWSLEEDERLKQAVAIHGSHKWSLIASHVPNRTPMQCSTRWLGALNPNIHKGRWTEYEDNILKYSVLEYANVTDNQGRIQPIPWNRIADRIPNRTGIQCQARWTEALDPYVRKGKWGADEDQLLRSGVKDHGRCWIRIAETIPGRTQRQCRTRWMQLQCKHNKQQQQEQQQHQRSSLSTTAMATPSLSTSSASTSSSSSSSSNNNVINVSDVAPYSSPSSIDDAASPSSTDDDTILLTTGPAPLSINTTTVPANHSSTYGSYSPHGTNTNKKIKHEYYSASGDNFSATMVQQQQQQHLPHMHHHYHHQPQTQYNYPAPSGSATSASTHPHEINYSQQRTIKQEFHAPSIQASPSDVYSYFNHLSQPTNVLPSKSQQLHHQ
ncbi:unnamed protein product [Absidia cylindrospora]